MDERFRSAPRGELDGSAATVYIRKCLRNTNPSFRAAALDDSNTVRVRLPADSAIGAHSQKAKTGREKEERAAHTLQPPLFSLFVPGDSLGW